MSELKFNVSGGNVSIGNVAQGEHVDARSGAVRAEQSIDASELTIRLTRALDELSPASEDLDAAKERAAELASALDERQPDPNRVSKILSLIKEHHAWAFPVIRSVIEAAAPAAKAWL